jgi:hypothetical protein
MADDEDSEEEILFVPTKSKQPSLDMNTLISALPLVPRTKRKILAILDLNGILFYRELISKTSTSTSNGSKPHAKVGKFYVWDRDHCQSFLDFLLGSFDVAVWSSAALVNVLPLVKRTFGDARSDSLVFVWDQDKCGMEKREGKTTRPLFVKELTKVWKEYPQYSNGNTILIDDDILKARYNPPNTAIHPSEWTKLQLDDQKLGPDGSIRRYLAGLSDALQSERRLKVEDYIKKYPFVEDS